MNFEEMFQNVDAQFDGDDQSRCSNFDYNEKPREPIKSKPMKKITSEMPKHPRFKSMHFDKYKLVPPSSPTLSAKPNAHINNSMMISDLHQLFKMLSENKNEFEMGGKKFKLNVRQTEIESMLSRSEKISNSNKESQQNATSIHTDSQHQKSSDRRHMTLSIDVGPKFQQIQ